MANVYDVSITNDGYVKLLDASNDFMQIIRLENQQLNYDNDYVSIVNMAGHETNFKWDQLNGINSPLQLKALLGFNNDNWLYSFSTDCNHFVFDGGGSGELIKIPIDNSLYNIGPFTVKISSNNVTYNFPYESISNIANQSEFINELNYYIGEGTMNSYANNINTTTTLTNIFSLGCRNDYGKHYKINNITLANDSTDLATFYIYKNPTVNGQSFVNIDASTSILNVDISGTTVTNGELLRSYVVSKNNNMLINHFSMCAFILPSNYITIAVKSSNALATGNLGASLNVYEFI